MKRMSEEEWGRLTLEDSRAIWTEARRARESEAELLDRSERLETVTQAIKKQRDSFGAHTVPWYALDALLAKAEGRE